MRIRQISLIEEWVDFPEDRDGYERYLMPKTEVRILKEGAIPMAVSMNVKREAYSVHKVWIEGKGFEYFGVKVDQRDLFDDLIKITDDQLEKIRHEAREEEYERCRDQMLRMEIQHYNTIQQIRYLPWWKRLLRQF